MPKNIYEFGEFRLDLVSRTLWRGKDRLALTGREFDTLLALVRRPGAPVDKKVLATDVWGATSVVDENLRKHISALRQKLGKDGDGTEYIKTIPNRGYQLAVNVNCLDGETPPQSHGDSPAEESERAWPGADVPTAASRTTGRRPGLTTLFISLVLLACGVTAWILLPRELQVLAFHQLTRDGRPKGSGPLTDGNTVYFTEVLAGTPVLASVRLTGGTIRYSELPLKGPALLAISKNRKSLLVFDGTTEALYELELGSLALRPIKLPEGAKAVTGAWNPAGSRVAIAGDDSVTVVDPRNGREPLELRFEGLPEVSSWDRLGRRLRFNVLDTKTGATRWWELASDEGTPHALPRMTMNPAESHGSWTSDGTYFVFQAGESGAAGRPQIWIAAEDSSRSYRLTLDAMAWRNPTTVPNAHTVLAFARQSQAQLVNLPISGHETSLQSSLSGVPGYELDYSRDGQWIAYSLFPDHTIWRCRVDGSDSKQLTPAGLEGHQPHWSPDGTRIAFMGKPADHGSRWRIYLSPSAGGSLYAPLPEGDDQGVPTWSPDGGSLIFGDVKIPLGFDRAAIHQLDLKTNAVTSIQAPMGMWSPRMSPDGKHLVAVSHDNTTLYIRDNLQKSWRQCMRMNFVGDPIWSANSSWIQLLGSRRPDERALFRTGLNCDGPKWILDLLRYSFAGDSWIGIAPDQSPIGLLSLSDELYSLDWRIRRSLP